MYEGLREEAEILRGLWDNAVKKDREGDAIRTIATDPDFKIRFVYQFNSFIDKILEVSQEENDGVDS